MKRYKNSSNPEPKQSVKVETEKWYNLGNGGNGRRDNR